MRGHLFLILLFSTGLANSQCLCGNITYQVVLPGIEFRNGVSQYSINSNYEIHGVGAQSYPGKYDLSNRPVFETECEADTFYFSVRTGSGIDSLEFTIKNKLTGEQMRVVTRHMGYDEDYYIELTTFHSGMFRFDWVPIAKCLQEEPTVKEINCNGLHVFHLKENYKYIRPVNIYDFSVR